MKKLFSALFIALTLSTAFLYAESQIANEAKSAIEKYAAFNELKNRGFKIEQLDNIQNAQELYDILLPYMIQNGKPLDNLISINGMDFVRHKNIVFEDTVGTKEQLLEKGYSEDQLFYYPALGKDLYKVGHFEWGNTTEVPTIWEQINFYRRPFVSKTTAYMWIPIITKDYFKPYFKELASKKNIILDFRMHSGGWGGQVQDLGMYLEKKKYKGKIILITDRTTKNDYIFSNEIKTGSWNNGVQDKGNLNWILIGENTLGVQKYIMNADWNYESEELWFSPLPKEKYPYAVCEEGVGVNPDVWAIGDEDILISLESITGDKEIRNLVKDPFALHNKLVGNKKFFYNEYWEIPSQFLKCKTNDEYNKCITEWLNQKISWTDFRKENLETLNNIGGWWFDVPECFKTIKDAKEYNEVFAKWMETRTAWTKLIVEDGAILKTIGGWWFDLPECFKTIKDAKEYNEVFAKWMEARTAWAKLIVEDGAVLKTIGGWWLEDPVSLAEIKNPQKYVSTFQNWISLKTWWTLFILNHQEVPKHNNLEIYKNNLDILFPDRSNPDEYIVQLDSYLKEQSLWIDYLMPHDYVIPASYEKSKKYKGLSEKIGKNCSSVPENIRELQKTNPEEYVNQMVSYINSVAENDFEKVQMVFSIEQEILKYDNTEYSKRLEKIAVAKEGVGEDYEKYSEKLNKLWEESGEEWKKQDWKTTLEEGVCVCDGYAQLMQWFCYKLGIKTDRIFTPKDMYFAVGHSWNIVQIEGEDYLLDATWGLSYLFMEPENFYKKGHFPYEAKEQLLKEPHTLEEFKALKNYNY